jgi:pyruvate dehydrogenase E2 component (dihydrolipoamide acetyltransferase)
METAKAVVDVPCPYSGTITKLHGQPGDVIDTGAVLVEFDGEVQTASTEASQTGNDSTTQLQNDIEELIDELDSNLPADKMPEQQYPKSKAELANNDDSGTVVGEMESSNQVVSDIASFGDVKIAPAVKALAKKLKVDLNDVVATGAGGVIRPSDIKLAHKMKSEAPKTPVAQATQHVAPIATPTPTPTPTPSAPPVQTVKPTTTASAPAKRVVSATTVTDEWQQVKGTRRAMARIMADAHAKIVPTTIMDDADIYKWQAGEDITARLIRAMVTGIKAEPALNSWFNGEKLARRIISHVDIGIAVDTPDGLFVPTMRNCEQRDAAEVRAGMNHIKEQVKNRSIPPEDMKDFTIMLSNFGVFAGRYATPVITPPCVAIMASGKLLQEVVPVLGGFEVHRMIPLSLTFDHRAVTGGEAARFLAAVIKDLNKSR